VRRNLKAFAAAWHRQWDARRWFSCGLPTIIILHNI